MKNKYLTVECQGYYHKLKFVKWLKKTKLYLEYSDLRFKKGIFGDFKIATIFFMDDKIKVETSEKYLKSVVNIFDDYSALKKINVEVKLESGQYY